MNACSPVIINGCGILEILCSNQTINSNCRLYFFYCNFLSLCLLRFVNTLRFRNLAIRYVSQDIPQAK